MNKTHFMGRLTRDVELRTTSNGINTARFSIAVDRTGVKDKADFIPCVAWRNTADFIAKYFHKGSPIIVHGALYSDSYEKDGENRTAYSVNVETAEFVLRDKNTTAVLNTDAPKSEAIDTFDAELTEMLEDDKDLPF